MYPARGRAGCRNQTRGGAHVEGRADQSPERLEKAGRGKQLLKNWTPDLEPNVMGGRSQQKQTVLTRFRKVDRQLGLEQRLHGQQRDRYTSQRGVCGGCVQAAESSLAFSMNC